MTTFKIKYAGKPTWYDISDVVYECQIIPIKTREKDFQLNSRGFTFSIPFSFEFESGESINTLQRVRFTNGYWDGFEGQVKKIEEDWVKRFYVLTVYNDIENLRNHLVTELDGPNLFSPDPQLYTPSDYYGREVASFLHVLKRMAEIAGSNIGFSNIGGEICCTGKEFVYPDYSTRIESNMVFFELKIDVKMLRCIGQNVARQEPTTELEAEESQWEEKNAATFFDVYNWFAAYFGLELRYDPRYLEYRFYTVNPDEKYDIDDDEKWGYKPQLVNASTGGVKFQIFGAKRANQSDPIQDKYYQTSDQELDSEFWYQQEVVNSFWPKNLLVTFEMREYRGTQYEGSMWPVLYAINEKLPIKSNRNYMNPEDTIKSIGEKFADSYKFHYENDYNIEEIKTRYAVANDTVAPKAIIQHKINIDGRFSIITQRTD